MKIYRECTKELHTFLTIDTTLSTSDLSRFRKNLFQSYKNDKNFRQENQTKQSTVSFRQKSS